jgi:hypothetical protein
MIHDFIHTVTEKGASFQLGTAARLAERMFLQAPGVHLILSKHVHNEVKFQNERALFHKENIPMRERTAAQSQVFTKYLSGKLDV